jgi:hypothetical protein
VATATAAIVVLTPANFYRFPRPELNFQPLSLTFETFDKKLAETNFYQSNLSSPSSVAALMV